jgi:hypothetical protein
VASAAVPFDEAVLSDPLSEDDDAAVDVPDASADMKVWRSPKSFERRSVPALDDAVLDAPVPGCVTLAVAAVDVADAVLSDVAPVVPPDVEPP